MDDSSAANAHVFISYLHENKEEAQRLYDDLTMHGTHVWLDLKDIPPGVQWKQGIHRAIQEGAFLNSQD